MVNEKVTAQSVVIIITQAIANINGERKEFILKICNLQQMLNYSLWFIIYISVKLLCQAIKNVFLQIKRVCVTIIIYLKVISHAL